MFPYPPFLTICGGLLSSFNQRLRINEYYLLPFESYQLHQP